VYIHISLASKLREEFKVTDQNTHGWITFFPTDALYMGPQQTAVIILTHLLASLPLGDNILDVLLEINRNFIEDQFSRKFFSKIPPHITTLHCRPSTPLHKLHFLTLYLTTHLLSSNQNQIQRPSQNPWPNPKVGGVGTFGELVGIGKDSNMN